MEDVTKDQALNPKQSLREVLGTKRREQPQSSKDGSSTTGKTPSANSADVDPKTPDTIESIEESIHTVIRLLAETKKIADAAIKERLSALDKGESTNKDFQKSIQTICSLSLPDEGTPGPETWEAASQTEILYSLREQIVGRVMLRNKRAFENSGPEEGAKMVNALGKFRRASRSAEIYYASRENMVPGSSRTDARLLMDSPKKAKTAALEEVLYCLTQIALGTIKDSSPKINAQTNLELQRASLLLQNPRNPKPDVSSLIMEQKNSILTPTDSKIKLLEKIKSIFDPLCTEERLKEKLTREIAIFDDIEQAIGTNIESLDALSQEEFSSVKTLEAVYDQLESVKRSESYSKPQTEEELQLAIFQGIREVAPSMGKTTTAVMTSQLSKDPEWVDKFLEVGSEAIHSAPSYKNLIVLTEPENSLFGEPGDPERYMEEGKSLRDALGLIYNAESAIYTRAIHESLSQKDREEILSQANQVLHEELSTEEMEANPILKTLNTIQLNADKMANAVSKEVEGSEKSLEILPIALKEKERQERVSESLSKAMTLLTRDEVSNALEQILKTEEESLATLLANPDTEDNDKAAIVHTKEKIATLEALRDFSINPYDLENKAYEDMISTIALTRVPRTLREHALISLCDNKAADGTRLKTKEMLMRLETESGVSKLTNMLRGHIGVLRQYKERESAPVTVKKKELALSICRAPENLKKSMREEIRAALKSCLTSPPWKNPYNTSTSDLGACNTSYLIAKKEYGEGDQLFNAIKALHSKTAEIQKDSDGSLWVRAEKVALSLRSKDPDSLKALETKVLNLALSSPNPKEALNYMTSWYNSIGYEATLQEESLHSPDEGYYHFEPLPLVATKIQTKIENLFEIGKYLKAVSNSPEALAETYIQQRLHEKRNTSTEAWEERLARSEKKIELEISQEIKELGQWKEKFNSIFDDQEDDDLTPEERDKQKSMKTVCQRKILQKERAVQTLVLKKERLINLKATSLSIKGAKNAKDVTKALASEEEKGFSLSMETALNAALKLAESPTKICLPQSTNKVATPLQMLEAAAIEKTLKNIKSTLNEAKDILKLRLPNVSDLDIENINPEKSVEELKKSAFKVLKEIEMHLWESGQSIKLSKEEEEEFIQSNPEMIEARKDWVETLKKTEATLHGTFEWAKKQPQIERRKIKEKEPKEEGPSKEDLEMDVIDMVAT